LAASLWIPPFQQALCCIKGHLRSQRRSQVSAAMQQHMVLPLPKQQRLIGRCLTRIICRIGAACSRPRTSARDCTRSCTCTRTDIIMTKTPRPALPSTFGCSLGPRITQGGARTRRDDDLGGPGDAGTSQAEAAAIDAAVVAAADCCSCCCRRCCRLAAGCWRCSLLLFAAATTTSAQDSSNHNLRPMRRLLLALAHTPAALHRLDADELGH
jgi:hypothetical protein